MKALFFFLCLLNVVFFFWKVHFGAFQAPAQEFSQIPTILLLNEKQIAARGVQISEYLDKTATDLESKVVTDVLAGLRQTQASTLLKSNLVSKVINQPDQSAKAEVCYEFGPFGVLTDLWRWANSKQIKEFKVSQKVMNTASDFQVYFPAGKDPEQIRSNLMMLKGKGFRDAWQITDDDLKGALSLGVFNDKQRALVFKSQLAEKGVEAEIRPRNKSRDALFIRFTEPDNLGNQSEYEKLTPGDCQ